MLNAILCHNDESTVWSLGKDEEDACMARLGVVLRGDERINNGRTAYSAALTAFSSARTSSVWRPRGGGSRRIETGLLEKRRPGFMAR